MVTTIYEPKLSRLEAVPIIEAALRKIYVASDHQMAPIQRTDLDDLKLVFFRHPDGVCFNIFQAGKRVMAGDLDPRRKSNRPYSNDWIDPYHWDRGRWEENFGIPMDAYDPHWDDRIPPVLSKTIRRAASLAPGNGPAKHALSLMIQYADGTFEDVLEYTLNGDENAAELACWAVCAARGPCMAVMVPLVMWVNGAPPADVLRAYAEAVNKHGARRRHLNEILGSTERVTRFMAHMVDAPGLERSIRTLRSMPSDEAITLVEALAERCSPLVRQVFPEGFDAFFGRFVANLDLNLRRTLAMRRRGLFS